MNEEDDLSALEQHMRAKLQTMQAKPAEQDATEKAMIAKLFGTKTEAEDFLRHEGRGTSPVQKSRIDIRRPKTFKPQKPLIKFEYWERSGDSYSHASWTIERYENGKLVKQHTGRDWQRRDEIIRSVLGSGVPCVPITVAGVVPEPIAQPKIEVRKKPVGRFDIMAKIGKLTTEDLENDE